ncbi:MAG: IS3 family transposase [Chthoniobacter sp.]|nr:IS3 family transposase [Chthoniobacter sp.]
MPTTTPPWKGCRAPPCPPFGLPAAGSARFFSTLKTECLHRHSPATRRESQAITFDYMESFYNRTRLHSALGEQSPVDFKNSHH